MGPAWSGSRDCQWTYARAADGGSPINIRVPTSTKAQEVAAVPPLTEAQNEAMDLLHEIGEEVCLRAPFNVGDMQFTTHHGRTPFTDDRDTGATREAWQEALSHRGGRPEP
jgi:hypothetical protein